jgi:hypothetical protein
MFDQNLIVGLIVVAVVVLALYAYAPKLKGLLSGLTREGFADAAKPKGAKFMDTPAANGSQGGNKMSGVGPAAMAAPSALAKPAEGFADYASVGESLGPVPMAAAKKPQGCYPREQMNPVDLLPSDPNSQWAQVNPTGAGDIQGKNFLSAGALIGINTIGQSLRNANLQLRAEPPCPQTQVSPWSQSTIEPDLSRKSLE